MPRRKKPSGEKTVGERGLARILRVSVRSLARYVKAGLLPKPSVVGGRDQWNRKAALTHFLTRVPKFKGMVEEEVARKYRPKDDEDGDGRYHDRDVNEENYDALFDPSSRPDSLAGVDLGLPRDSFL